MIISHKYKYIFIKTTKTAGTSVEISLARFCGENDIITPLMKKDEITRQELGVFPRNYTKPKNLSAYNGKEFLRLLLKGKKALSGETLFYNHITAQEIKEIVGEKIWHSYFKFCFVRNPWDRAISRYFWTKKKMEIEETLEENLEKHDPNSNFPIYTIDGKLAVDYVAKYENLLEELNFICKKLNIPFDNWLPNAKMNSRPDQRDYKDILTPQQADLIQEKCAQEIQLFDYKY